MESKEKIINSAIELIKEKGKDINNITMRDICKKSNVGLGLINYHFKSKNILIETCVERIINSTVENFKIMQSSIYNLSPFEKLQFSGTLTLDFLFENENICKISVLTDMNKPKINDNTTKTYTSFLPLVRECRPDWDEDTLKRKTLFLITIMQQLFLRCDTVSKILNTDFRIKKNRDKYHTQLLHDILEM